MAFQWRTLGLVFGGCVAVLVLAEVIEDAVEPPGRLADHLASTYTDMRDARPPLEVAVELDDAWQPEDQRYTAVGVLLRYERDVVALVPDGRGGTIIERHSADAGYRRFYDYVGSYWGARYSEGDDVPRSAMAVPDEADTRAVTRRLQHAGRVQEGCYGWEVEIRGGRRKGRFTGPPIPPDCRYVKLYGWIDPNAGRLRRKGSSGDWSRGYEWTLDGEIREASISAIDTPLVELIEGAMQQPAGERHRAGKGLIEHLHVMPLLAQDVRTIVPSPRACHPASRMARAQRQWSAPTPSAASRSPGRRSRSRSLAWRRSSSSPSCSSGSSWPRSRGSSAACAPDQLTRPVAAHSSARERGRPIMATVPSSRIGRWSDAGCSARNAATSPGPRPSASTPNSA
jgi:hypothetical protein